MHCRIVPLLQLILEICIYVSILCMCYCNLTYLCYRLICFKKLVLAHLQLTKRLAHEYLAECPNCRSHSGKLVYVTFPHPSAYPVVYNAFGICNFPLLLNPLHRGCWRHCVWHLKNGGDTSVGGSPAPACPVLLVLHARLAEMRVDVNDSRQHQLLLEDECLLRLLKLPANLSYSPVTYTYLAFNKPSVKQCTPGKLQFVHRPPNNINNTHLKLWL